MQAVQALEETELLEDLLSRVESVQDVLQQYAPESDAQGFLHPESVRALDSTGLLRMKVVREFGGFEARPSTQMLVLARIAEIDPATAWNVMVNNNASGWLSAYLSEELLEQVLDDGRAPIASGVTPAFGTAVRVPGGYRVTGRWRTCSGVQQSAWVRLNCAIEGEEGRTVYAFVPKSAAVVHPESWEVFGLRGTGSFDVSLDDYFLPEAWGLSPDASPLRGGPQYRLSGLISAAYEHAGIALGIAKRALSALADHAARTGKTNDRMLEDLGRLGIELECAFEGATRTFDDLYEALADDSVSHEAEALRGQAVTTYVTELALECAETAYQHAGTAALYLPNAFEQTLRDIHGATQHVAASANNYRVYAANAVQARKQGR